MRMSRILEPDAWYKVATAVNRHEPLFLERNAVDLFNRTFREAGEHFPCEVRCLRIEPDRVSFYIKPADGLHLPEIMQWIKQTYSVRYNVHDGRTGHIWGDRYASRIMAGGRRRTRRSMFSRRRFARRGAEGGGAGRARAEGCR